MRGVVELAGVCFIAECLHCIDDCYDRDLEGWVSIYTQTVGLDEATYEEQPFREEPIVLGDHGDEEVLVVVHGFLML